MGSDDDSEDDLGDGRDGMSEAEVDKLEASLVPVRLMQLDSNSDQDYLIACHSFELSPTLSRIPPPSSSPNGLKSLRISASGSG